MLEMAPLRWSFRWRTVGHLCGRCRRPRLVIKYLHGKNNGLRKCVARWRPERRKWANSWAARAAVGALGKLVFL